MPLVSAETAAVTLALALLACFVAWGARTGPHRPFSWGMYSGSSKGFLWTRHGSADRRPRLVTHHELGLSPEAHFLTVPELRRLLEVTRPAFPFEGLIIGSQGDWWVRYDEVSGRLRVARMPPGSGLARLCAQLRRPA